jgi:hypothetical protein
MSCPNCGALLPEPRERFCPTCGTDLDAPGADLDAQPPASTTPQPRPGTPWEDRGRIGFIQALVETTQRVLTRPSAFFASMPTMGGIGGPLLYAIVVGSLGVIVAALYREIFSALTGSTFATLGGRSELRRVMPFLTGAFAVVLQVVFAPVMVIIGLFVVTSIVHVMLLMLGGARRGFEATFRVLCYSEATAVINIVPLCGGVIYGVYYLIVAIIGLSTAHGIGKGTAAAAVLLPLAFLCCCCAGGAMLAASGVAAFLSQVLK